MSSLKAIREEMHGMKNKEQARNLQRFFKTGPGDYGEGDIFLGIKVPVLRKLAKKYRKITVKEVTQLLRSSIHEERWLALLMLVNIYSNGDGTEKKKIYDLYLKNTKFINNWDLVDGSAQHIIGDFLRDKDKEPLYRLAKSTDLWERRISIMSTFIFIRNNEFSDALKISEILLYDKEDLIHKAVGWMLREVGKRDIKSEEDFLKRHYKDMPRTTLRYAIEKFPESKRKCYLKGDI